MSRRHYVPNVSDLSTSKTIVVVFPIFSHTTRRCIVCCLFDCFFFVNQSLTRNRKIFDAMYKTFIAKTKKGENCGASSPCCLGQILSDQKNYQFYHFIMASARPVVSVLDSADGTTVKSSLKLPEVFTAPIRLDVVQHVQRDMAKNKRQAYAVSLEAIRFFYWISYSHLFIKIDIQPTIYA